MPYPARSLFALSLALVLGNVLAAGESELVAARRGFTTKLLRRESAGEAPAVPPTKELNLVHYPGPLGDMAAYVSPDPADGKRRPLVVWLFGGFSNSIGDTAWEPGPPENDQSASGFRRAGILVLYPSLRGGNRNPGFIENFFGEVDDVIAAIRYAKQLPYVDPQRVYLGGHSTGGTLALLVAESGVECRAIFSLGPVENVVGYGADMLTFDLAKPREVELREPKRWLGSVVTPTFVFEGTQPPGNAVSLRVLLAANRNPAIRFRAVRSADHFSLIAPLVREIAVRINADTGDQVTMNFRDLTEFATGKP